MSEHGSTFITPIANPTTEAMFEKNAIAIQVSAEVLGDAIDIQAMMASATDIWLHPWKRPDKIDWPEFVPAPRLAAFTERMVERRQRIRDAWSVLRGRDRIYDPDEDWD